MKKLFFYDTSIGEIGIAENGKAITNVYLSRQDAQKKLGSEEVIEEETMLIKKAISQLNEYLLGKRSRFDLPLEPSGTQFMLSVWNELLNIPYGNTCSYGDIAKAIGNPKAARAVGLANNKNNIPIFIPCHRVIGANGKLVGYAGGLEMKKKLLHIENEYK